MGKAKSSGTEKRDREVRDTTETPSREQLQHATHETVDTLRNLSQALLRMKGTCQSIEEKLAKRDKERALKKAKRDGTQNDEISAARSIAKRK